MLPLFHQMKVYKHDILYGQGDQSEEIFFIIMGRVKFYYLHSLKTEKEKQKHKELQLE